MSVLEPCQVSKHYNPTITICYVQGLMKHILVIAAGQLSQLQGNYNNDMCWLLEVKS